MKNLFIVGISALLFNCKSDPPVVAPTDNSASDVVSISTLKSIFQNEGNRRGINIDFKNLSIVIKENLGSAGLSDDSKNTVFLDKATWEDYDNAEKETLLFHELGHALIGRNHESLRLPNGEFVSIMRAGDANTVDGVDYQGEKRKYYLDELFNTKTPKPDWTNFYNYTDTYSIDSRILKFEDKFNDNFNKWTVSEQDSLTIKEGKYIVKGLSKSQLINAPIRVDTTANFDIEFDLKVVGRNTVNTIGVIYFGEINSRTSIPLRIYTETNSISVNLNGFNYFGVNYVLPNFSQNDFNKFKIRKANGKIYVFVNDKFVYQWTQPKKQFEKPFWIVNFIGSQAEYQFDNFKYFVLAK